MIQSCLLQILRYELFLNWANVKTKVSVLDDMDSQHAETCHARAEQKAKVNIVILCQAIPPFWRV